VSSSDPVSRQASAPKVAPRPDASDDPIAAGGRAPAGASPTSSDASSNGSSGNSKGGQSPTSAAAATVRLPATKTAPDRPSIETSPGQAAAPTPSSEAATKPAATTVRMPAVPAAPSAAPAAPPPGPSVTAPTAGTASGPGVRLSPPTATAAPGPRTVRLTVARIDPWSALKLSFLLSVALGIALVVATIVLWQVLNGMGLFDTLESTLRDVGGVQSQFNLDDYVGLSRVISFATLVAVFNVITIMALTTLGAVLYNIAGSLVGGLHITLADD